MNDVENPERGRRARNIIVGTFVLIIVWVALSGALLYHIAYFKDSPHWVSLCILVGAVALGLLNTIKNLASLFIANDNIFPYSGQPLPMLNKLYESLSLNSQTNLALFSVAVISILMAENIVKSEAGLPIISAIIGYTVAKNIQKEDHGKKEDG